MNNEKEINQIKGKRKFKKKRKVFKRLLLFIFIVVGAYGIMRLSYFNIKEIEVVGNVTLDKESVIKESNFDIGDNVFFFKKSKRIDKMKENPVYKNIEIDRVLPNKISIKIEEREDKVLLPYGDRFVVLSDEGIVLRLSKERLKLSEIKNIKVKNMEKGKMLEAKDEDQFKKSLNILKEAEENDMFFLWTDVDKEDVKINVYGNLYIKSKYDHLIEAIKSKNLKSVIANLVSKNISRGTISIRNKDEISFSPSFD